MPLRETSRPAVETNLGESLHLVTGPRAPRTSRLVGTCRSDYIRFCDVSLVYCFRVRKDTPPTSPKGEYLFRSIKTVQSGATQTGIALPVVHLVLSSCFPVSKPAKVSRMLAFLPAQRRPDSFRYSTPTAFPAHREIGMIRRGLFHVIEDPDAFLHAGFPDLPTSKASH
jgi:hypothetical protein